MNKLTKRIAAMAGAVMMIASISAMSASAATDANFSFYISTGGAVTSKTCYPGDALEDDHVFAGVVISRKSDNVSLTYNVSVGGISFSKVTTSTSYGMEYSSSNIERGDRILMPTSMNPSPAGIGSSISGYTYGS